MNEWVESNGFPGARWFVVSRRPVVQAGVGLAVGRREKSQSQTENVDVRDYYAGVSSRRGYGEYMLSYTSCPRDPSGQD